MKTIEEVRKMFEGDRFPLQNGAVIEEFSRNGYCNGISRRMKNSV